MRIPDADELGRVEFVNNPQSLRRTLKALELKIAENQDLRSRYQDEPSKFLESEVDLDELVRQLKAIGSEPTLVKTFLECDGTPILMSLLAHMNPDIAGTAASVLTELIDPEVLVGSEEEAAKAFVDTIMGDYDVFGMMTDLLNRVGEDFPGDDLDLLQCVENLLDAMPQRVVKELLENRRLLSWLLNRIATPGADMDFDTLHAAELIATVTTQIQNETDMMRFAAPDHMNGIDHILRGLSRYKKSDSFRSSSEKEFVMNLKDALVACLLMEPVRHILVDLEGVELMLRILRNRFEPTQDLALETLSLVMLDNPKAVKIFVQEKGLGIISPLLLGTKGRDDKTAERMKELENVLIIWHQLVTKSEGPEQKRIITKLFEDDCLRLRALVSYMFQLWNECKAIEEEIDDWTPLKNYQTCEVDEDANAAWATFTVEQIAHETEVYSERCANGLISLQLICRLLLALCDYGNEVLLMQIHILLDPAYEQTENRSGLFILQTVMKEYVDMLITEEEAGERQRTLANLKRFLEGHPKLISRSKDYINEAAVQDEARKRKAAEQAAQTALEEKRARRTHEKMKAKMAKWDRELEAQERLEQIRYDRKHGA